MKHILFLLLFIFINLSLFNEERIKIGIVPPFKKNNTPFTAFYNSQFIFEFLTVYNYENYEIVLINPEEYNSENNYYEKSLEEVFKKEADYLFFSVVYEVQPYLVFKVMLIDPYNEDLVFNKTFVNQGSSFFNESLVFNIKDTIDMIKVVNLRKNYKKSMIFNKKKGKEAQNKFFLQNKEQFKHEFLIQNGFLKVQPNMMTFFSWYFGYNFTPFKFFKIESTFFLGTGDLEKKFNFDNKDYFKHFFFGTYGAFYFFLSVFFIEPFIGLKLEFSYIVNNFVYFYLPIDLGIKIFISEKDCIRIDTNFQFLNLNINYGIWENSFIVGLLLGYARKI